MKKNFLHQPRKVKQIARLAIIVTLFFSAITFYRDAKNKNIKEIVSKKQAREHLYYFELKINN